jgi:hypothetical protein
MLVLWLRRCGLPAHGERLRQDHIAVRWEADQLLWPEGEKHWDPDGSRASVDLDFSARPERGVEAVRGCSQRLRSRCRRDSSWILELCRFGIQPPYVCIFQKGQAFPMPRSSLGGSKPTLSRLLDWLNASNR